uniref:Inositol 1,4,5-trisphosphate receptor n=1 Tax=Macrostomum lignano TaxID=282301 RepID=A0A1I8IDC1_9PLAT
TQEPMASAAAGAAAAAIDTGISQGDMNSGFVCIGDYIGLYCEDTDGHVFSQNSCAAFNGLFVYHSCHRDRPLKHVFTGKYVHVNTNHTSQHDKNNMLLSLHEYNSKNAQFRILPRYKVKSEGEHVQLLDQISLESIKSPGHYFHSSKGFKIGPESRPTFVSELNLGVEQTGFTIIKSHGFSGNHEAYARGGQFVQLFHKELEAYVVAEGLFDQDVTEDVHLRIREIDQLNPRTLHSSTSAVTYWQVEPESTVLDGEVLTWDQQFRFRHATTRKYLCVKQASEAYSVTLTEDATDPHTVFKMHPVLQDSPELKFESYARIEHVITGCWLHAIKGVELNDFFNFFDWSEFNKSYQRKEFLNMEDEKSMRALRWDGGELREITCCFDRRYDDAYTIQKVDSEHVMNFNFVAGVVPTLQDLIDARQIGRPLTSKETFRICHALRELRNFMLVNGEPCKARQKLLRNLRVIDLLVTLLKFPLKAVQDEHNLTKVFSEAYDILHTYMMGNSRKNALYFAKYIEFFQTQMVDKSELALKVTKMLVELMKDNRKIVDRISNAQIEVFVELLRKNEHHSYLELLKVLCVCNGVAITENQNFIAQKWLLEDTRGVYMTNRGQNIDRKPNETYVSYDQQHSWLPLVDFVQPDAYDTEAVERCLFLHTQLDLFIALCHGRNEDCIRLITKDLSYLTWEEAYLGLSSESLPHEFRAKYCEIIIGLFVNVGNNYSVVESPQLCFIYEYIGTKDFTYQTSSPEQYAAKDLVTIFPVIRDWIAEFLDQNRMMVASQVANNILIEQVLKLLHYLVKFGYYGEVHDLARLLPALRNLLDGQNDIPFPPDRMPAREFSKERKKAVLRFKQTERFRRSPETQAIVRAKHAALQVLDLVMTFQENARLASFIKKFKDSEISEVATRRKHIHPLVPALYDSFDPFDTRKSALQVQKRMKKELRIMFEESSRHVDNIALTSILIDLAHYEYDPMVQLSLQLLNKLHSAKSSMFNLAVNSLVLITPDSCRVHREVGKQVPLLKMMIRSKWTSDQAVKIETILSELRELCHLPKAEEEPHPMNQRLMLSHNVLGVVFDILSTETDVQLTEKYHETVGVLRKAVRLMKALTIRYEDVQNQVFNNLDSMLRVRLVEPDLALALKEVFVNNQELCLKILPRQISRIVGLVAENQERAPEFLELLSAIVKVEGPGLALKRNQTLVMKYIMQNYSKVGYVLEQCTTKDRMEVLNGNRGASHCQYLISLVDLLATCAEGENRYIESLCQTIISVEEILCILNDPNVENHLKKPFLRYMFYAYMKTSGSTAENRSPDIIQDRLVWEYVRHLTLEFDGLTRWIRNDAARDTVYFMSMRPFPKILRLHDACPLCSTLVAEDETQPLKLNLENAVVRMREDDFRGHASLHYVFDAVLPFLQAFANKFYQTEEDKDTQSERDMFDRLTLSAIGLCSELAAIVVEPRILTQMVACLSALVRKSSHRPTIMEPVVENIGKGTKLQDTVSQMKSGNKEYYEQEIILNSKLKTLAVNMSLLWGGQNTVRAQLKYSSDREYTVIGGEESLPLDEEFQDHVRCFISAGSRKPEGRYRLAGLLVNGLRITAVSSTASASHAAAAAADPGAGGRGDTERLAIRILQILRAFIHNEERKLPEDWEVRMSEFRVKRGLKNIAEIQNTLNSFDLMKHALPHLASTSGLVAKEVLSLLGIMLFNANEKVQQSMLKYFLNTKEEVFFFAVRNRLQVSTANIKEKRLLISQQKARQMDARSQADDLKATMTLGVKALQQIQQYHVEMKIEQANSDLTVSFIKFIIN